MPGALQAYYRLTKPGIIYGNALPTIAGFLLASRRHVDFGLFALTLLGSSLVIAAACICNNYLDRGIDRKMARTRQRELVTGLIGSRQALGFALVLGLIGEVALAFTNVLTALLAALGFVLYVIVYGIAKRRTVYGTVVGSLSGALPPVIGYCAVSGQLDWTALLLFALLTAWQMPHFYAIASYRLQDYATAGIPVWPAVRGLAATRRQIIIYILALELVVVGLAIVGHAGWLFGIGSLIVVTGWLVRSLSDLFNRDAERWARRVFLDSLVVLTGICVLLSLGNWLV